MQEPSVQLLVPDLSLLPAYRRYLSTDWSPDNVRTELVARLQLAEIARDPERFIASLTDPEGRNPMIELPDGRLIKPLPSLTRWIWTDGFCGSIQLRWTPGSDALPEHCPGHVGYSIVPEQRNQGLATLAMRRLLPIAWEVGLRELSIQTKRSNIASQKVIEKAGGVRVCSSEPDAADGTECDLAFKIMLSQQLEKPPAGLPSGERAPQ